VRRWADDIFGQGLDSLEVHEEAIEEADDTLVASIRVQSRAGD
jgi:hypothetical protein